MGFKDLDLQTGYDSDEADISQVFYKPVLSHSMSYHRLSGYFSSTTFAIAIKETLDFIKRNGKIKLITSTELSQQDFSAIQDVINGNTSRFESDLIKKISEESDPALRDCNAIMGWMLSNTIGEEPQLEIKIAVPLTEQGEPSTNSIFHQKVGIFYDGENEIISFEGSVNETGRGWTENIEKFKIAKTWSDESDKKRVELDVKTFEKFWNNQGKRTMVIDLPEAVKNELIKVRPKSTAEFNEIIKRLEKNLTLNVKKSFLRDYQQRAIDAWRKNNSQGIFEMATGTGKTFTALAAINGILDQRNRLVVIVSVPYTHLIEQWEKAFESFTNNFDTGMNLTNFKIQKCYGEIPDWKVKIRRRIRDINEKDIGGKYFLNKLLIFTTHTTLSSTGFIELMQGINSDILLIADEMHAVGSELRLAGLSKKYNLRLGLSATPNRYFDDEGTKKLIEYFDKTVFEFNIGDAIKGGHLSNYEYVPEIVTLTDDEFLKYKELTIKIAKKLSNQRGTSEEQEITSFVEGERAGIISAAVKKYDAFKKILDGLPSLNQCLIYCHEKQLEQVKEILYERNVIFHQITYREPTLERIKILNLLSQGSYDAVVAVNCLDEGVDIPSAKIGIILASSGNPKQYIQRRGRLLRKEKRKSMARIFDILVVPFLDRDPNEISLLEKKIVQKEITRYSDFLQFASNKDEAEGIIGKIRQTYSV